MCECLCGLDCKRKEAAESRGARKMMVAQSVKLVMVCWFKLPIRSDVIQRKGRSSQRKSCRIDSRRFSMPSSLFDHNLLCIPPTVLAAQITLLDLPLFQAIPRKELQACDWNCKLKQNVSPRIVAFIAQFNQVCYWLVREILKVAEVKARCERLTHIIHLADALLELNNINSLKAVMSALSSQPVFRLSQTWDLLSKKDQATYTRLSNLLSEDNNKAALRAYMETAARPCIPFLGMYLTDLLFLNTARQGADPTMAHTSKERMQALIDNICVLQMSSYEELEDNSGVRDYIQSHRYLDEMQIFEEDQHYKMSLALEPPFVQPRPCTTASSTVASTSTSNSSLTSASCTGPSSESSPVPVAKPGGVLGTRSAVLSRASARDNAGSLSLSRSLSLEQPSMLQGHRRSRSNCDRQDFLFSLSVIAPEAACGPRHLIDGSLMSSTLSVGSEGTITCSSSNGSAGDITSVEETNVVGVAVRCEESDDDSENLLSNELCDSDDYSDSMDSLRSNCNWDYPLIIGNVQIRKVQSKRDLEPLSPTTFRARQTGSLKSGAGGFIRPWKTTSARVCGNALAFFPVSSTRASKRKERRNTTTSSEPFHIIDLDSDANISCDKARTICIARPLELAVVLKFQTEEERNSWLSVISDTIAKSGQHTEPEPAHLLIDFNEPLCTA
eukprot:scpid39980/ scgid5386/ Ras-specific guanine nucleotide-releasing factor RalGPS1; Ral GEF with PH domain and SH3-binding motif 1; Ral guanine nucleotide exchange factor 2; RalA exchange factor RalGPS1